MSCFIEIGASLTAMRAGQLGESAIVRCPFCNTLNVVRDDPLVQHTPEVADRDAIIIGTFRCNPYNDQHRFVLMMSLSPYEDAWTMYAVARFAFNESE